MGHHRGMKNDKEDKKHYRNCNNSYAIELTPDHILNCPAIIPKLLLTIDLHEDNIELIAKTVIDVHGYI